EFLQSFKNENALSILNLVSLVKKYPQEAFASIFDENVAVLARWDRLNSGFLPQGRRGVGIAGNDSPQNAGIPVVATEDGLEIRNALDKVIGQVPSAKVPRLLVGALKPGATVLSQTFDPYEVSFHYVSTHLLAPAVSEESLMEALRKG